MSRRVTITRTKQRLLSTATLCGISAFAMFGGPGSASAAPPGFSGPFTAAYKGYKAGEDLLGIGNAKVEWWRDSSGGGTVFTDSGNYSTYAGVIYVSMANLHHYDCAWRVR